MAENVNLRVERTSSSSARVTPVFDEPRIHGDEQGIDMFSEVPLDLPASGGDVEFSGGRQEAELNPIDAWLPITESRKGNTFTATVHLLCSGIGFQALLLPIAFVSLGWTWGIICLSLAYVWQLYTTWLLVNLHESAPRPGVRYSRFLHLSIVAFGPKLGKLLAIYPTLYLSSGACLLTVNAGATTMRSLYEIMCDNDLECKANTLRGVEWFLVIICVAIFIALFFPNLDSLAPVTFIGSITAIAFCTLLWVLSITQAGGSNNVVVQQVVAEGHNGFRDVMNGIAIIVLVFRGHNLVLEIQGTLPSNHKVPSAKPMWRGVIVSYILIAACLYPLAIVGHWAYGNKVTINGGVLSAFTKFQQNHTSKYLIGGVHLIVIINYLCSFQIYAMVSLDNLERIYVTKNNRPCPRWVRYAWKVSFGGVIYFLAVALPFMPRIATLVGSIALPLTLVYPCFMWVAIKKPLRFSRMWCLNLGLASLGILLSILIFISAVWNLVVNHFHANFFNP